MLKHIVINGYVYELDYSYSRKLLHDDVDEIYAEVLIDVVNDDEKSEEEEEELAKIHEKISEKDAEGLEKVMCEVFDYTDGLEVEVIEKTLYEVLKEEGWEVEQSYSGSLYVKTDKGEVRISDHKRPPVMEGAIAYEWSYDGEIIEKSGKISVGKLKEYGINVEGNYYYL